MQDISDLLITFFWNGFSENIITFWIAWAGIAQLNSSCGWISSVAEKSALHPTMPSVNVFYLNLLICGSHRDCLKCLRTLPAVTDIFFISLSAVIVTAIGSFYFLSLLLCAMSRCSLSPILTDTLYSWNISLLPIQGILRTHMLAWI